MIRKWQIQEAKARFAELVRRANSEGPQIVTHRGADSAVVLSMEAYQKLNAARPSFAQHILNGPTLEDEFVDLINERNKDTGRDIDL